MRLLLIILSLSFIQNLTCQVYGTIRDEQGQLLSFVSVFVENTGRGTTSNDLGEYEINLQKDDQVLVFQQIGFEKLRLNVQDIKGRVQRNIILKSIQYKLDEAVFVASREDPAYAIIRNAIQKRKEYEVVDSSYSCKVYSKGMLKMLDAPEKVLGQSVGNLGGNLDSTRKGILYLSESVSELFIEKGLTVKEIMLSSKVAGNDRGFSFNRAGALDFNLYKNVVTFGRAIISPIADYALSYYKYKLKGSNLNSEGHLIHKIELVPKINADPCWRGYIYIQDSTWSIYEFDAYLFGAQIKQDAFDTVFLQQRNFFLESINSWILRSQNFSFSAGFLGFKLKGIFLVSNSEFKKDDHSVIARKNEVLEILSGSNKKSKTYWDSIRPVPLTEEEARNYKIKDSIRIYKDTRNYKDSMDRISNRFEYTDLLLGFDFKNTYRRRYFTIQSILNSIQFNPIQGLVAGTHINYEKYLDTFLWNRKHESDLGITYGFSDRTWQSEFTHEFKPGDEEESSYVLRLGRKLNEFRPNVNTNLFYNQFFSLYFKNNYLKVFQQDFIQAEFSTDLHYDLRFRMHSGYFIRGNKLNNSNYSFRYRDSLYLDNSSTIFNDSFLLVNNRILFQTGFRFSYQARTKVWKTPDGIQKIGSEWPVIGIHPQFNYYPDIRKLNIMLNVNINFIKDIGRWGDIVNSITYVRAFGSRPDIAEAIHPGANPFVVNDLDNNLNFKVLKPYQKIGFREGFECHLEYNMQGLILDRIFLLNKLGLTEIFSYSLLGIDRDRNYSEFSVGFGNIGYKIFRYLRVNWVKTRTGSQWGPSYLRFSVNNVFQLGVK